MAVEVDPLAFQKGFQATQNLYDTARQNRLADLAFGQKQQELAQQNALAGVVGDIANYDQAGNLKREALPQIAQASPGSLPQYQKVISEQQAQQAAQQKAQRDQLMAQFDWADKNLAGVQNQAQYDEFRTRAAQVYPDVAARLPAQFDAAAIQANRMKMIPVVDQWKAEQEADRFRQQQETARRGQDISVRGQDLSSETARRGQDITARGQDLTNARAKEANGNKAPTEFQGKSAGYGARAEEADRIINSLGNASPASVNAKQAVGRVPLIGGALEMVGNAVLSPENQQLEQAQRDFVNATLRQESGAAISQGEFENAKRQYFPQPGDSPEVIAQKASNRKLAIEGFKRSAGNAAFSAPKQGGAAQPDQSAALQELKRRAQSDPALAEKLKAMGY